MSVCAPMDHERYDPTANTRYVRQSHQRRLTIVVSADFESLVPPHHQSNLFRFLMLQQSHIPSSPLLPFGRLGDESEELGAPVRGGEGKLVLGVNFIVMVDRLARHWQGQHRAFRPL